MSTETELDALRVAYNRLYVAALAVVNGAEAVGSPERPRCALEPHLIRRLRRELDDEPQPTAFATMSVS